MMLAMLLIAAQPGGEAPDPRLACAPVENLTAAGPPPPVLYAQRMEVVSQDRVGLSVHRCHDGGFRVERQRSGPQSAARGPREWVPVAQCAAIGQWIEAATRLSLPSPMLRPHRTGASPQRGTWITLHAPVLGGARSVWQMELEILNPPDAPPNALTGWFADGERVFRTCRDQGNGGEGLLPSGGRISR